MLYDGKHAELRLRSEKDDPKENEFLEERRKRIVCRLYAKGPRVGFTYVQSLYECWMSVRPGGENCEGSMDSFLAWTYGKDLLGPSAVRCFWNALSRHFTERQG